MLCLHILIFLMYMIFSKKQFFIVVVLLLIISPIHLYAQTETNKTPLFTPKENLPSLINNNPKNNIPLNLDINKINSEPNINMDISEREKFINPSEYYTSRLNRKKDESDKMPDKYKNDMYLGDYLTSENSVNVTFRDHEYPDGDRIQIRVNDKLVVANILLVETFKGLNIELEEGFNRIDFIALNQGESGPNTAELKVYTNSGSLVGSNQWNLATGVKATYIVVKE